MAWVPKSLADISFILVGPVLRKVTPNSINVFIATKESCTAWVTIYKRNETAEAELIATGTGSEMMQIGAHMFVNILSVTVPNGMQPGVTYGYNVAFNINGNTYTIWDIENYDGIHDVLRLAIDTLPFNISGTKYLPTFVLPPNDATKLRVLHGSCRKAHGEGLDAMGNVFKILYYTAADPGSTAEPRPQMMFLTGDQIYADDVSDIMLYMIDKYAQLLLGWDENLAPLGCDINNLAPGQRADNILNVAKFTVDKEVAGSHLMKLREFILMYCMTWSNVLWQDDPSNPGFPVLPSYEDVYPDDPMHGAVTPVFPISGGPQFIIDDNDEKYKTYEKHTDFLSKLYQSVNKNFRATIANIPMYMILDDHEITDDLFYNGQWFQDAVENSPLGNRICTNGMAAYALFQDWGNKPEDYVTGSIGKVLLNLIAGLRTNSSDTVVWNTISSIVLPVLDTSSSPARFKHLDPVDGIATSLAWNYYYEVSDAYEFIVLDTRTMRVFNDGVDGLPGLLSEDAMIKQIATPGSDKSKPLIFVISPSPIIGVNRIDRKKLVGLKLHNLVPLFPSKEELDLENWSSDKKAYEHVYSKLFTRNSNATFLQVILLGGDVHYAYSSRMQYWANQPYNEPAPPIGVKKNMAIAGLCASSFKNETSASNVKPKERLVKAYTKAYQNVELKKITDKSVIYGLQNLSGTAINVTIDGDDPIDFPYVIHSNGDSPFVFDRNEEIDEDEITEITNSISRDWQYRTFPMDKINTGFVPTSTTGYTLDNYKSHMQAHKEAYDKAGLGGRYIVGNNNMGDIMLESGTQGIGFVYHQIWWASDDDKHNYDISTTFPSSGSPYTIHKIDMGLYSEPTLNTL